VGDAGGNLPVASVNHIWRRCIWYPSRRSANRVRILQSFPKWYHHRRWQRWQHIPESCARRPLLLEPGCLRRTGS